MGGIVSKFGGSSTADGDRLRRVADLLRQGPSRRCAVLSAPGTGPGDANKITDLLEECWKLSRQGKPVEAPAHAVARRFAGIGAQLGMELSVEGILNELYEAAQRSRAHLLSRGEVLCARLFARWQGLPCVDAVEVIRFDPAGNLDATATDALLCAAGERHERFILPGFYGADPLGAIHTFPRNGSDITGALAAAALHAEVYENWTDVPGLMTADPAIVPDAIPIPRIGYRQMLALSAAGARVLHPDCLAPVARAGIPTHLRCTLDPESPGTWIDEGLQDFVPCVTGKPEGPDRRGRGMASVTVFGASPGDRARLIAALDGALVAEDGERHRFLTSEECLQADLRAAHRVLFRRGTR